MGRLAGRRKGRFQSQLPSHRSDRSRLGRQTDAVGWNPAGRFSVRGRRDAGRSRRVAQGADRHPLDRHSAEDARLGGAVTPTILTVEVEERRGQLMGSETTVRQLGLVR